VITKDRLFQQNFIYLQLPAVSRYIWACKSAPH